VLGNGTQDVDAQLVGVRHIHGDEIHARFQQVRDECHIPGKSI
jgi:hypothetical protein